MKRFLSKHPLISFYLMAFLFSWFAVAPRLSNPDLPVEPFLILGALLGPALSAFIMIGVTEGRAGLRDFSRRILRWRVGIFWWFIVLFGILVALNVIASLFLGLSIIREFLLHAGSILPTYLFALFFGVILGPLWEEIGWRGFALPRLQSRYGPVAASIVVGMLWAFWHIPGYPGGWMEAAFPALLISSIGFSVIATWIYNNTAGSILLMILLHSSSNAAISVGTMVLPTNLSAEMNAFVYGGWIPAIMNGLVAVLLLLVTKGHLSYSGLGTVSLDGVELTKEIPLGS